MSATVRYDEQYCPIARALDVLGDRWTLLILRELAGRDQRFTELRQHLPGIAPTLLTQRLKTLVEQGLVASTPLPAPAARSAYSITARGREAVPVMRALARFGMPLLEPHDDQPVRPSMAVGACITAYFDPVAAAGIDERYLFRLDGDEQVLSTVRGGVRRGVRRGVRGDADREPDLVLESTAALWVDIRQGRLTVRQAIRGKRLKVTGPASALANAQRIYRLP